MDTIKPSDYKHPIVAGDTLRFAVDMKLPIAIEFAI